MPTPDGPVTVSTLALLLADLDDQASARLLAEHTADRSGYCRGCTLPQGGMTRWPCTLHGIAEGAEKVRKGRGEA